MLISCIGRISLLVEGANRLLVSALLHPKIGHPGLRLGFQGAFPHVSGQTYHPTRQPAPLGIFYPTSLIAVDYELPPYLIHVMPQRVEDPCTASSVCLFLAKTLWTRNPGSPGT